MVSNVLQSIKDLGIDMWLVWIPAHVGIAGNEAADKLAKRAISFEEISQPIPLSIQEVKPIILEY